jgi:large subunit ribosomal protein L10
VNKEQKAAAVQEIAERLGEADAIFAVDYRGISVPEAAELRSRLREADATFRVVKNRLAKRAAEQAGTTELDELFDGPIALTFVKGDAVVAAKAIFTFSRQHEVLEYRGGLMDGEPLDPEQFRAIARLPCLDVLHGQLVGVAASWPAASARCSPASPSRWARSRRRGWLRPRKCRNQMNPRPKSRKRPKLSPPRNPKRTRRMPRELQRRNRQWQRRRCPPRIGSRS